MRPAKRVYKWYAIYTRVNQEKKLRALLEERKIECYLPLTRVLRQWCDRKKWIEEPLFRSYIFVRVSYHEYYDVLDLSGVVGYVTFGGKPQSIPDIQIENIKTLVKQKEVEIVLTRERISRGIKAEVNSGLLKGVQGEVVQICGQSRILIRMKGMGCCLHTNISKDEVKILELETTK